MAIGNQGPVVTRLVDTLRELGFVVPIDAREVYLDSDVEPTRIRFDKGERKTLSADEARVVLDAIRLHKIRHQVGKP